MTVFVAARRPARQAGFTLMEIAIVLGIVGLIMGAIWQAASSAHNAQKNNDAFNELQAVSQNMVSLFAGQPFATTGDITSNMITAQVIPNAFVNAGPPITAITPWTGGTFKITAISPRVYRLSFYGVPYNGCLALIPQATSCQAGQLGCPTGAYTAAAGSSLTAASGGTLGWAQAATFTAVQTLCKKNTGATNSVEFDYSI